MSEALYVRLRPYNPKMGCLVQRYHVKGVMYVTDSNTGRPVWYKTAPDVAEFLATLKQEDNNPMAPGLFDICEESEYKRVAKREEELRLVELGVMTATVTTPIIQTAVVDRVSPPQGRAAAVPPPAPPAAEAPEPEAEDDPEPPDDDDDGALEDTDPEPEPEVEAPKPPSSTRRGSKKKSKKVT